jgi:predicted transcriptional regulator
MVCINLDGSLSPHAKAICKSLIHPGSLDDIARNTNMPAQRLHPCLQELLAAGLVTENQGIYRITDIGIAQLNF